MTYTQHPFSAAFPPMSDAAFAEFCADIAVNGVHNNTIPIFEDQVREGWHRVRACGETGRPPLRDISQHAPPPSQREPARDHRGETHYDSRPRRKITRRCGIGTG
jgi:hypothetical protein